MIEPDNESEIEVRIRRELDGYRVPAVRLRIRPGRVPRVLPVVSAIALVLLALGLGQLVNTYRIGVAASTPNPGLPALPAGVGRDDAIALVRNLDLVGRVDRIDAKLMSYAEYVQGAGPVGTHPGDTAASPTTGFGMNGDPTTRYLWVVAVAGDVWPSGRAPVTFGGPSNPSETPYPPYRWGVFLIDAPSGQLIVVADAGTADTWPPGFAALPAHPRRP